jgi:SAM-dependent methyltransferase
MPEIFRNAQARGSTEVKFLSAGCAVGPEPYSLAMIAHDKKPKGINLKIHASDINQDLLDTARFATYSKQYVAEMNAAEVSKYFDLNKFGEHVVKANIRRSVNFSKKDIMKDEFPHGVDLIFCRNVLIYIDRDAQNQVISKFINALKPGGYLVLGRTETLFLDWRKYVDIISAKHRIYQKKTSVIIDPAKEFPPEERKPFMIKEKPKVDLTSRLEDLRNFRSVFEGRKKKWEKRIDDTRIANEKLRQKKMRSTTTTSKKPFSPLSVPARIYETRRQSSKPGTLTNYRSMLKKVGDKSKVSTVRRDKPTHRKKEEENVSPEEYYRRLKERRKKRKR